MKVTFYIIPQSFCAKGVSLCDVINSIYAFLSEYSTIDSFNDENEIIVDDNIYEAMLPNGMTLGEYAYNISDAEGEERDMKSSLQRILQRHNKKITIEQICKQIDENSMDGCAGIISMVPIECIADKSQIVYDKSSWYDFRRYHLGLFHGEAEYFIDECRKFYPNMFFHNHNKDSVGNILKSFARTIIFHLNGIHDILPDLMEKHPEFNQTELLRELSDKAKFPEVATPEGGGNKKYMKFGFKPDNGDKNIEVLCELHAKLCYDDSNDGKYHKDKRIYFHKGRKDIAGGRILIGHIGKHL